MTENLRLIAGISNVTDEKCYDRVFANGTEPAPLRFGYAGVSFSF
jgi:outer membrane receptor protein involved in Fe transport